MQLLSAWFNFFFTKCKHCQNWSLPKFLILIHSDECPAVALDHFDAPLLKNHLQVKSWQALNLSQIILEFQMMTDLVARDKNRWEHVGEGVWNATDMTFRRVGELLFNSLIFNFLGNSGNILFFYQDFEFCLFVFRPSVVMWSAGNEPRSYRKEIFQKPIFWRSSWTLKLRTFGWPGRYFDQEPKWILLC